MFHIMAYSANNGIADANVDLPAVVDPTFTRRGGASGTSHYIFTERYNLLAAQGLGADLSDMRFNVPTWNAWARHHIFPVLAAANQPVPTWLADYRDSPLEIPINEEIAIEESGASAAGGDPTTAFMWISLPGWRRDLPTGVQRIFARFTATATGVANAWSTDVAVTFTENLKGGVYAVLGCEMVQATTRAFRLNFVRSPIISGRKFFPGNIVTVAAGTVPLQKGTNWLGQWGRFHTFELPQLAIFATTAGAKTIAGFMDLLYLGENQGLLAA